MVVGTDIAELLMKNRNTEDFCRESVSSSSSTQQLDVTQETTTEATRSSPGIHYKEDYITDKFREYLLYGSGKEALGMLLLYFNLHRQLISTYLLLYVL